MMRRLDENICAKADRQSIKEFKEYCEMQFVSKEANKQVAVVIEGKVKDFGVRIEEVENMVKFQARQLQKEMFSAVRRAFNQHQSKEENQPVSMATVLTEVKGIVSIKADKDQVEKIVDEKANKVDTEMCLRWVDLLHKMVNKVVLLLTTKLKTDIDQSVETVNNQKNKKVQLLQ